MREVTYAKAFFIWLTAIDRKWTEGITTLNTDKKETVMKVFTRCQCQWVCAYMIACQYSLEKFVTLNVNLNWRPIYNSPCGASVMLPITTCWHRNQCRNMVGFGINTSRVPVVTTKPCYPNKNIGFPQSIKHSVLYGLWKPYMFLSSPICMFCSL